MNVRVSDLMVAQVMTARPHQTCGHVKKLLHQHPVSCLPVVGPDNEPVGIISATDLLADRPEGTPVSQFMTTPVFTVPQYADVSLAARVMRNHHIHHVVVTHEQAIVGIISSFDLLKLVEDHRFTVKNAPKAPGRKTTRSQ